MFEKTIFRFVSLMCSKLLDSFKLMPNINISESTFLKSGAFLKILDPESQNVMDSDDVIGFV
jgi:hypothetical protein